MTAAANNSALAELVPIDDRMRYMQGFRVLVVIAVVLATLLSGDGLATTYTTLGLVTGGYIAAAILSHGAWRISRRAGVALFGVLLMADGAYLAWTSYVTGADASPLRLVIVFHLVAVALLASHRTGMKVALWHSLLLLVIYYAQDGGLLRQLDAGGLIGSPLQNVLAYTATFWFVTIATASLSAVNERELRRRRYDLEALAELATRLEGGEDSASAAAILLESVTDAFGFDRTLLLGSPEDEGLVVLAERGTTATAGEEADIDVGSVTVDTMVTRRRHLLTGFDPETDAWLAEHVPDARNVVVVPLTAEGHAIGVLVAEHGLRAGSRIERRVVSMVERFTSHGALALSNAWLLDRMRAMATTDGLTGITNRRSFEERLTSELGRAARSGEDVSLVLIDIDHFKQVNDVHGHQTGDDVLRRVAGLLRDGGRTYDLAARFGGEEFIVMLPRTSMADGMLVAERLRVAIEEAEGEPKVTISAGVSCYPHGAADGNELVATADAALYESKRGGRNRVTSASASLAAAQ